MELMRQPNKKQKSILVMTRTSIIGFPPLSQHVFISNIFMFSFMFMLCRVVAYFAQSHTGRREAQQIITHQAMVLLTSLLQTPGLSRNI